MKTFRIVVVNHEASRAVGQPRHVVQVEVIGAFKTRKAFAQALVAAGLSYNENQGLREMRRSGGETWNKESCEVTSANPEQLFVGKLNRLKDDKHVPWPPPSTEETV